MERAPMTAGHRPQRFAQRSCQTPSWAHVRPSSRSQRRAGGCAAVVNIPAVILRQCSAGAGYDRQSEVMVPIADSADRRPSTRRPSSILVRVGHSSLNLVSLLLAWGVALMCASCRECCIMF
jgi:hypothetical protein